MCGLPCGYEGFFIFRTPQQRQMRNFVRGLGIGVIEPESERLEWLIRDEALDTVGLCASDIGVRRTIGTRVDEVLDVDMEVGHAKVQTVGKQCLLESRVPS